MVQNATKARNVKVANRVVPAVQDAARLLVAGALQENAGKLYSKWLWLQCIQKAESQGVVEEKQIGTSLGANKLNLFSQPFRSHRTSTHLRSSKHLARKGLKVAAKATWQWMKVESFSRTLVASSGFTRVGPGRWNGVIFSATSLWTSKASDIQKQCRMGKTSTDEPTESKDVWGISFVVRSTLPFYGDTALRLLSSWLAASRNCIETNPGFRRHMKVLSSLSSDPILEPNTTNRIITTSSDER